MNTIFRSQIFPRLLNTGIAKSIPSISTSYVRNFSKSVFQDISIKPRDFYQIPPLRENYKLVTLKNDEAYDIEDANRDAYYEGRYDRASNALRSWLIRYNNPKTLWSAYTKPTWLRNETTHSIFADSQDSHMTIPQIEEVLEKKGGRALDNLSQDDLIKIWDRLKQQNESDRMIELFHTRGPSNFTASPATLLDYCFANLKSSYSQPPTVTTFAKKLIEQQNLPQAHFILGLSHMGSAYIAKKLADLAKEGKRDDRLEALYRECFYLAPCPRAPQKYQEALKSAEVHLTEAFNMEFSGPNGLSLILNLIELGNLAEATLKSELVWEKLHQLSSLTTQDIQALLIAGIVTSQPQDILKGMAQVMLESDPHLKEEYVENLNLLLPHFPHVMEMMDTM